MNDRRETFIVDRKPQHNQAVLKVLVAVIAANVMIVVAFYLFPYELNTVIGPLTWVVALLEILLVTAVLYLSGRTR